ncbi:MAG TPA: Fur family transcriptional regulator [bacterium]|nr:Fur family transcriptional regulator [bacterium]
MDSVLRAAGLKATAPRRALLQLLKKKHGPFTIEELGVLMKGKASCDPVTVYRCLSQFEKANLVRRCDFGDGVARYEFRHEDEHHHHVICRKCSKVKNFDDDCLIDALEEVVKKMGYKDVTHSLEFFGTCASCR